MPCHAKFATVKPTIPHTIIIPNLSRQVSNAMPCQIRHKQTHYAVPRLLQRNLPCHDRFLEANPSRRVCLQHRKPQCHVCCTLTGHHAMFATQPRHVCYTKTHNAIFATQKPTLPCLLHKNPQCYVCYLKRQYHICHTKTYLAMFAT